MIICYLRSFRGDAFDDTKNLYEEDCEATDIDSLAIRSAEQNTFETRTERVKLKVKTTAALDVIANALFLQFPDLPSDLDIRVNGGPPAWTAPGVAQPNTRGWDSTTHQIVELTNVLAALSGDPHDMTAFDANIVLSSRIPGLLSLTQEAVDIAYLARVAFGDSEETALTLPEEGQYDIVLPLPSWVVAVQEVRFTIIGTVPPERILQPIGPPRALQSGGDGAAYDLMLDVDHAGAARLDAALPFAELSGIRLPLNAGVDGAEVRAVLYQGTDDNPTKPVDGGTSKPVDLASAAPDAGDVWTTFSMAKPVKLDHTLTYWVVIVVGRGNASWSLGSFANASETIPMRRGAANGPWHELPNVIVNGSTLGARVRVVGKAPPTVPVAPLVVTVAGHETSQINVTPTPKGLSAAWIAPGVSSGTSHASFAPTNTGGAKSITLRFTSRMTGSVKVSAVDVVATK